MRRHLAERLIKVTWEGDIERLNRSEEEHRTFEHLAGVQLGVALIGIHRDQHRSRVRVDAVLRVARGERVQDGGSVEFAQRGQILRFLQILGIAVLELADVDLLIALAISDTATGPHDRGHRSSASDAGRTAVGGRCGAVGGSM